ncbi:amino acid adenylation domain-containing protein [Nocardia sp. NPDC060256]|uniref:amino acid adenylation domain-containing protein n=1 Tax=unclassified Nocardia TaxID=2637762 RepID=UPI0036484356
MSTIATPQHRLRDSRSALPPNENINAERYPLSAAQRRAWFLQTRDPEDTTLNICVAYRLTGPLDVPRLRAAVDTVVARHDILCTTYGLGADGEPFQLARPDVQPSWQEHDLSELAEPSRARRLEVLARREFGRPFALADEAPLRFTLVRTGPDDVVVILVAHTICWDDDSWSVLRAELNAAYNGVAPSERATQFVEVAELGNDAKSAEPDNAAVEYWRRTLRPLPESLELPGKPIAADTEARRTGRCVLPISAELIGRVYAFAGDADSTPFAVGLAAFHAVINRYTAATDFLVSVPVSTRGEDAVSVIGYFGNTVLLRAAVRPEDTFAGFAASVRDTCAAAFAHQDVGIDRVIREINPGRGNGRDGLEQLVRVGFGVREAPRGFEFDGVTATGLDLGRTEPQVPLRVTTVFDAHGVHLEAEYWAGEIEHELVEQLLAHYVRLLDSALSAPEERVGDLDIFGAQDRSRLLAQSHGELIVTPPSTVVALFERTVSAAPAAQAVVAPRHEHTAAVSLTYDQLNRRANRLAHWLISQGVGSEDVVALRLGNSVEFVVAVLAVLKSGGAYLPIDPADPDDRIEEFYRDAGPRLVFGMVELMAAEEAAAGLPDHDPTGAELVRPLRPGNLAYLIYTSGSTGKAKGVAVSHAAIAEHLVGFGAEWGITAEDRLLQSSPVSFDASLLDIFVTLTVGACLVIPKPAAFRDIPYVADLIARYGITVLHMVPSTLSTFLLLPEVSEWRALRHVPVGGEALLGEVADRFAGVFDAELRNHYGPTEAVVSATHLPVDGPQGTRIVPIGVPNRNVYCYLLDDRLQLVPHGVVGEIYLGGAQLARGYLHRSDLTAERFVADPFLPGQRLYRTGDLARRAADGVLEFVGRADAQVKVRGFRIELAEVEATIAAHPGVGHCAVVAVADRSIGTMLAAYVVAAADGLDLEQVRTHLVASLPEYMVPSAFTLIDEIPLTKHGKLDRDALPEPVRVAHGYREPGTATEIRLVELYQEIFGLDRVGADDSFFDLGGHSLLANRLVPRLRAEFGIEIDVRVLIDNPTVAGLAALIEATPVVVPAELTAAERERVLGEWSTGVELDEVPDLAEVIRRGHGFPGARTAVRYGAKVLTYGDVFARLAAGRPDEVAPTIDTAGRLVRLVTTLICTSPESSCAAHDLVLPDAAALAVAVADRRAVAGDRRCGRADPAYRAADVRLLAMRHLDVRAAVELFAALADGAMLIVATESQCADAAELVALITEFAVTHVVTEAAIAAEIARADQPATTVCRWDITGIDTAPTLPALLAAVSPGAVATIAYASPEYVGAVARGPLDGSGRVRPIPGARVLVLDERGGPVRPGVLGEVFIGGAAVGREGGAAAGPFLADPFAPGWLVRTGDRASWTDEGWLVFAQP